MSAVPIYVWNGTAWQETGPTIPASPIKYQASAPSSPSTGDIWVDSDGDVTSGSTQLQRFRFVASGGETSLSGNDANGATLAYTAGMEQVVLNGAVLVRGHDYTATNGTSITGLSPALVANDVVEVFSFMAFNVANTYTQSQVDGLLDSYVGLRLIIPGSATNGTVSATGKVTFSAVSSISVNDVFSATYDNYLIIIDDIIKSSSSGDLALQFRLRVSGTDSTANYTWGQNYALYASATTGASNLNNGSYFLALAANATNKSATQLAIQNPFLAKPTTMQSLATMHDAGSYIAGNHSASTSYTGFSLVAASGTMTTGTIRVYGYKN